MHTKKVRTNITIDKELLEDARKYRISVSGFIDVELRRYLALIRSNYIINDYQSSRQSSGENTLYNNEVGLPRFELKSIAPEATRMPSYPTGPKLNIKMINYKKCFLEIN